MSMTPTAEQGICVYQLNDYEWFAGTDLESTITFALNLWGMTREEAIESGALWDDPAEYEPCTLDADHVDVGEADQYDVGEAADPEGQLLTFRERLRQMIAEARQFPSFFCGIDA